VPDDTEDLASLKGTLDRVQLWTAAADQKTEILTAIETLALGFLLPQVSEWLDGEHTTSLIKVLLHASCLVLGVGVAVSVYALFPRTAPTVGSLTFFGTIQGIPLEEYRRRLSGMDPAGWRDDYTAQIHECSRIAFTKFSLLKQSVRLFAAGLAVLVFTYVMALARY
jgi:hypothetical protein